MNALGKDWVLWIDGKALPCQQAYASKADNEVIQIMHKGQRTSRYRVYEPALAAITISAEGVQDATRYGTMMQMWADGYELHWELKYQGAGMLSGRGIITSVGGSAPNQALSKYDIELQSTGQIYFGASPVSGYTLDEVLKNGNTSAVPILAPIYASALGLPIIDQLSTQTPAPVLAGKPAFGMGSDGKLYRWPIGATTWLSASPDGLPSQTGNADSVLYTDGSNASWVRRGLLTVATVTGTAYTLNDSDNNEIIRFTNAGAITVTIPSDLNLPIGANLLLLQEGLGTITVQAGSGVTLITSRNERRSLNQNSLLTLALIAANTWVLGGEKQV